MDCTIIYNKDSLTFKTYSMTDLNKIRLDIKIDENQHVSESMLKEYEGKEIKLIQPGCDDTKWISKCKFLRCHKIYKRPEIRIMLQRIGQCQLYTPSLSIINEL